MKKEPSNLDLLNLAYFTSHVLKFVSCLVWVNNLFLFIDEWYSVVFIDHHVFNQLQTEEIFSCFHYLLFWAP